MKYTFGKRILAMALALCLILALVPVSMSIEAEAAISGVDSLTCASFISNSTRRNYIDVMMKYYINNYSSLQNTLNNGLSVVFMFEGGSDNYDAYEYVDAEWSTRLQAVCIVVQLNSSGNAEIVFYSENCTSIPDDANYVTEGSETYGSTTILDGIYGFQTVNHNGNYAAFNTYCSTGWYTPYEGYTGYSGYCNGINIHTRSGSYCAGENAGWCNSAGCQVIGYGASSSNEYNTFMKVVAGITFNAYDGTQRTMSNTYVEKGYYVVDRQLGLLSPDGTEYGSGSLAELYTTADLAGITKFSTNARANASFGYTSKCTFYPSHCQFKTTKSTPINSEPCAVGNNGSETLETAASGATYTAVGMYQNTGSNFWYQVKTSSGKTGYIFSGHTSYVKDLTSDITVSGLSTPNGHVAGNIFYVEGTISSKYNYLDTAEVWIRSGFGTTGTQVTGGSDSVNGYSYTLVNSAIDYATAFDTVSTGKYTYVVSVDYTNYYAKAAQTLGTNTGTKYLCDEYFVVVSSSVDQSTCSHSYSTTAIKAATCTASGTQVKSCSKCGIVSESTVAAAGHSYGSWTTVDATCTADGSKTRTCSKCGNVETQTITASGHDYAMVTHEATCQEYAIYEFTCGNCGDNYKLSADELASSWIEAIPEGMDEGLFNTKTQYRYSDYETTTSYETSLSGYTVKSSEWVQSGTGTVNYVNSWPSGFSTSNSLYTKYNNKSSKKTASETTTAKTVINSDAAVGYLYYHWCYSGSYYSVESKSGSYTTFHAFYSTQNPSDCTNYDASDGSYYYPNSSCCSNSDWYWYATVNAQKYTTYNKLFTYERWTDYTDWSDTAATASNTRKVETRTVYQLKSAELGTHSYEAVVTAPTCTAGGYTTYTCSSCGDSYTGNTTSAAGHNWSEGVCGTCGTVCEHGYANGICSVCGMAEPVKDYYLFGWINGADYACEGDYANMGEYKFVDGQLVVTFESDSYVGVKAANNTAWYMTDGWQGYETTTATLYNTNAIDTDDKLYVPGGVEITFTLTVNEDDTLTLSYVAAEPEVTLPTVSLVGPALQFEDEILLTIYYTVSDMTSVTEMGMLTWTAAPSVVSYDAAETVFANYYLNGSRYGTNTDGIPAKMLGDTIYFCIYAKLSDGSYVYSKQVSYSPKTYAYNQLKGTNEDVKPLVVAMLNYGAAAQTYFKYNTENLVNADLTDAQKALVVEYSSDMVSALTAVDSTKAGVFTNSGGFSKKSPSISFEGAFSINYYFTLSNVPDTTPKMYYWDEATFNSVSVLKPTNATGCIILDGETTFMGTIEGIAAKDLNRTIYVAAGYMYNGNSYCTGVLPYSIGKYCVSQATSGPEAFQPFAKATAVYGYYANDYFSNL